MKHLIKRALILLYVILLTILVLGCTEAKDNNPDEDINLNAEEETEEETAKQNSIELSISDGYVEFGSYPQREIVSKASDSGTYAKVWEDDNDYIIDENTYKLLQNLSDDQWDTNGDTIIDGNKYRRIKKEDATYAASGDANYYDWLSEDTYHYFIYEPITWKVLAQDENEAFLMSDIVLDDQMYNTVITDLTWEESSIRRWLNGYDDSNESFIDSAFTKEEQELIQAKIQINADSLKHGTEGGNDTEDKIFLLSENEVYTSSASAYGFSEDYNADDVNRQRKSSSYAKAMGVYTESENSELGNCFWWLRSPGSHPGLFILVRCDGSVYRGGQHANSKSRGVCPALYVKLGNN